MRGETLVAGVPWLSPLEQVAGRKWHALVQRRNPVIRHKVFGWVAVAVAAVCLSGQSATDVVASSVTSRHAEPAETAEACLEVCFDSSWGGRVANRSSEQWKPGLSGYSEGNFYVFADVDSDVSHL
jgi:hypothetical protein